MPFAGPMQLESGMVLGAAVVPRSQSPLSNELMVGTSAAPASWCYSAGVAHMTTRGWRPVQGGLYWPIGPLLNNMGAWAFLREASDDGVVRVVIGGGFSGGFNEIGTEVVAVPSANTSRFDGRYFQAMGDCPGEVTTLASYEGDVIGCAGVPFIHDDEQLIWTALSENYDNVGEYHHLSSYGGLLWVLGRYEINGGTIVTATTWNGVSITDASPDEDTYKILRAVVGDIGDGESLYIARDTYSGESIIQVRTEGSWADVGVLEGGVLSIAIVDFGGTIGSRLMACGTMTIDSVWYHVVMFDGDAWVGIAQVNGLQNLSDLRGASDEWLPKKMTLCGDFSIIYDVVNDRNVECYMIAQYHPDSGWAAYPWGGVNGLAMRLG